MDSGFSFSQTLGSLSNRFGFSRFQHIQTLQAYLLDSFCSFINFLRTEADSGTIIFGPPAIFFKLLTSLLCLSSFLKNGIKFGLVSFPKQSVIFSKVLVRKC